MKAFVRILIAMILLSSWTALFIEHRARNKSNEEIHSLRLHLAAIQEDLANTRARLNGREDEVKRLRNATKEIYKLRNQAGMIQDKEKKIEELLGEIQHLRETGIVRVTKATDFGRNGSEQNIWSKENWGFAGYATPETALQSLAWAVREGDWQKFLESQTPEERKKTEADLANDKRPADQRKSDLQDWVKDVNSVKILEKKIISDDEVILAIYTEGEGDVERYPVKRIGNEWKVGNCETIGNLFKK